ncbi:MAG TPA: site-2 protease family protein [Patescibacteria group bacterium]|nr:site-2 protease family protein [Patescibacteria group bacterium]
MEILFFIFVLIFSIVIHEFSHGAVANMLGDPTAKLAGRLTLNPLKHLDPIGSVVLPVLMILTTGTGIGWAKPVPVNPFNFRDQKYGSLKVALAGPAANLTVALFLGLFLRLLFFFGVASPVLFSALSFIIFVNILLAMFNLTPVPPLDGSHILFALLPDSLREIKIFLSQFGFFILIFLIFFFPPFLRIIIYLVENIFILFAGTPPPL